MGPGSAARVAAIFVVFTLSPWLSPRTAAAAPVVWGCHPAMQSDPCQGSLKTSYLDSFIWQPRHVARVDEPARRVSRKVDCFFVYPTVSSEPKPSASLRMTGEVQAILRYQAARFSQACRVFAPIYRQLTHLGVFGPIDNRTELADIAYSDVLGAWRQYLAEDNDGRGVVLIGHSQGSGMLKRLIREEIDPFPDRRAQLVSAILAGSNLTVERGRRVGGDFASIPVCANGDETGCAVAWSTFGAMPPQKSQFGRVRSPDSFGRPASPNAEVVCANPAALAGDGDRLDTISRSEPFPGLIGLQLEVMFLGLAPKAATPWVVPAERYRARCVTSNGANVLMVRSAKAGTIVPIATPSAGYGLHLADINLVLGNLVRLVSRQIAAYERVH